jgi:glutaredoxin-related protein
MAGFNTCTICLDTFEKNFEIVQAWRYIKGWDKLPNLKEFLILRENVYERKDVL